MRKRVVSFNLPPLKRRVQESSLKGLEAVMRGKSKRGFIWRDLRKQGVRRRAGRRVGTREGNTEAARKMVEFLDRGWQEERGKGADGLVEQGWQEVNGQGGATVLQRGQEARRVG